MTSAAAIGAALALSHVPAMAQTAAPARTVEEAAGANCNANQPLSSDNCSWALPQGDFTAFTYENIQDCLRPEQRGSETAAGLTCAVGLQSEGRADDRVYIHSRSGTYINFTRAAQPNGENLVIVESTAPTASGRNHHTAITNVSGREIIVRDESRGAYVVVSYDNPITSYCGVNQQFAEAMNAAYAASVVTVGYDANYQYANACRPTAPGR